MARTCGRIVCPALLGFFGAAGPLAAQEMWLGTPSGSATLSIEALRPSYRSSSSYYAVPDQSLASGAVFVTARLLVRSDLRVVVEVPAARGAFDAQSQYGAPATSGFALGNPYIGVETGASGSHFSVEGGVRVPIVGEPTSSDQSVALEVGALSDLERAEAFASRVASVSLFPNFRVATADGFRFRVRGGPVADIYTAGASSKAMDLWLGYGMQAGYEGRVLSVYGGFAGRTILTEDLGGVGQRTLDEFVASASFNLGGVRPGIVLRLPLDDQMNQVVGHVLGVTLAVPLGR